MWFYFTLLHTLILIFQFFSLNKALSFNDHHFKMSRVDHGTSFAANCKRYEKSTRKSRRFYSSVVLHKNYG